MFVFYKMRESQNDYLDTRIVKLYQIQVLNVADSCSKAITNRWEIDLTGISSLIF